MRQSAGCPGGYAISNPADRVVSSDAGKTWDLEHGIVLRDANVLDLPLTLPPGFDNDISPGALSGIFAAVQSTLSVGPRLAIKEVL